ncbi:MAG TPA: hypothetical protein VGO68_05525 [Pyrinomonadaceae bacterium]|jgi:hypothetical protein|nr:hypothetical protein [Pyrinomonadaceae bacterium]
MYRRPKFLEVLHAIREKMSRDVDYDVDLFAEMVRSGAKPTHGPERIIRGVRTRAQADEIQEDLDEYEERPKKRAGKLKIVKKQAGS